MNLRKLVILPLLALFSLVAACGNQPPAEEPCNFVQNSFGRRVSWAQMPIQFYADSSIKNTQSEPMFAVLMEAMEVWNQYFDRPVFEMIGRAPGLPAPVQRPDGRVQADGFNGVYLVGPDFFKNTTQHDEQARASINFRGDFIYEADILIDSSERFFYENQETRESQSAIHFKSLMIHELGHVLGLSHIDIAGVESVMQSRLGKGFNPNRVALQAVDVQSLQCEYQ